VGAEFSPPHSFFFRFQFRRNRFGPLAFVFSGLLIRSAGHGPPVSLARTPPARAGDAERCSPRHTPPIPCMAR